MALRSSLEFTLGPHSSSSGCHQLRLMGHSDPESGQFRGWGDHLPVREVVGEARCGHLGDGRCPLALVGLFLRVEEVEAGEGELLVGVLLRCQLPDQLRYESPLALNLQIINMLKKKHIYKKKSITSSMVNQSFSKVLMGKL